MKTVQIKMVGGDVFVYALRASTIYNFFTKVTMGTWLEIVSVNLGEKTVYLNPAHIVSVVILD